MRHDAAPIHGCVKVDMDSTRMLQVSRLCATLPVFASEALRKYPISSVRFHRGEWLVVVAGNELFLWKYTSSHQSQSHSPCLKFSLPASDMPHSALLIGLIYPTGGYGPSTTLHNFSPVGCLALSSGCDSLRLWPRLAHNSVHVDTNLLSTLGGSCCDEAVQLEPTSVPGVFLFATRTGHLALLDSRDAQDGVHCRLLSGLDATGPASSGLLSGIGRRVSNLFSMVSASATGFPTKLAHARGGGNLLFVRLVTRPNATPDGTCFVYMLLDSQLDVWCLDGTLKEQLQGVHSIDELLSGSDDCVSGQWRAVDMAVQHRLHSDLNEDLIYVLVTNAAVASRGPPSHHSVLHLVTIRVTNTGKSPASYSQLFLHPVAQVPKIHWPFPSGCADALQLCMPAKTDSDADGGRALYPCLLGCLYHTPSGHALTFEVLTGQAVAHLTFGSGPTNPSALIGSGSVDAEHLFVYVTRQRGLVALAPTGEYTDVCSTDDTSTLAPADSTALPSESAVGKPRGSMISLDSQSIDSIRPRPDRVSVVAVDTIDQGRVQRAVQLTPDGISVSDVGDPLRSSSPPRQLAHADLGFVVLSEAARVFWMGFPEQSTKYLTTLLQDPHVHQHVPQLFLRLARRILNERPLSDPRWRTVLQSAFLTEEEQRILSPEGCTTGFHFVQSSTSESPLLPNARSLAKLEAVNRLRCLWYVASASTQCRTATPLEIVQYLGPTFNAVSEDLEASEDLASSTRRFAGESWLTPLAFGALPPDADAVTRFSCNLADQDNEVEACAARLLRSLDADRITRCAEDEPSADDTDHHSAVAHLSSAFNMAEEMIEFSKAVQLKLSQEPLAAIQSALQLTARASGFSESSLQTIRAKEAVFQTITIVPSFISTVCDQLTDELPPPVSHVTGGDLDASFGLRPKPAQLVRSPATVDLLLTVSGFVLAGLSAVCNYRDRHLPELYRAVADLSAGPDIGHTHYLPCWITDAQPPYGIGDALLGLFDQLVRLGSGELSTPTHDPTPRSRAEDHVREAAEHATQLAVDLLTLARQRLQWATVHSRWAWTPQGEAGREPMERLCCVQRLRRMRYWFVRLREYLIDSIADRLHRPDSALHLAERFADCAQMVRLCYALELQHESDASAMDELDDGPTGMPSRTHHVRLAELIQRVPSSYGLADCALQWYFSRGEHARVQSLLALLDQLDKQPPGATIISKSTDDDVHVNAADRSRDPSHHEFLKPETPKPAAQQQQPKRLSKSTKAARTDNPVSRFIHRQDAHDLAWPHLLSTRHYEEASRILFEDGCKEIRFLGRRKTLLSLAKLALLASDPPDGHSRLVQPDRPAVERLLEEKIDLLLECVSLQERLPTELRSRCPRLGHSDEDPRFDPVLDADTLARLYVSVCPSTGSLITTTTTTKPCGEILATSTPALVTKFECGLPEFRAAFRLASLAVELADFLPPPQPESDETEIPTELVLHLWCQALKKDNWSNIPEHEDPVQICSRSFVCALVRNLSETDDAALKMLFTPDKLLACPELAEFRADPQFRFLVQSGFEYMQSIVV